MKENERKYAFIWGAFITRTENIRQNCGEASRMKGEHQPGALPKIPPDNRSRTYALPASTIALERNPKNRPRRTAVRDKPIRLATCLDRSAAASGAIAPTLLLATLGGKRPPPAERLPLV